MKARLTPFALVFVTACGAGGKDNASAFPDAHASSDAATSGQCFSSNECPVGWTCSEFGQCIAPPPMLIDGGVAPPPPEKEQELKMPVSSLRYVWVAMTDQDKLAKIDGATLDVSSIPVGHHPEVVVTMPGTDTAVVLDEVDDPHIQTGGTATVVRPANGSDTTEIYPVLPNFNRIATSPDGRYAVAYFDLAKAILDAGSLQAVKHIGSYQDVSVLSLEPGKQAHVDLTVGFKPRAVEFDSTAKHAYVITEMGVSIIDLAEVTQNAPTIIPPVAVTDDPSGNVGDAEVHVLASGDYAVVRTPGQASLRIVKITGTDAGTATTIPLATEPTDVDLDPTGARIYAVTRNPATLTAIDVPADLADPSAIESADLGDILAGQLTLSPDGKRAVLYTNAFLDEHVTVVDLTKAGLPHATYSLQKSVRTIGFDPTSAHVVVIHARAPGDPQQAQTFDEYIDRSPGYSSVDLATGFSKLQITPVDPGTFSFAPDAPRAYLTLDGGDTDGSTWEVQEIELDTGVVRSIPLNSPPSAIGVLPGANDGKVFVNQRHPLGRVTFVDVVTNEVRTVTGFDLNSRVVD
ncbi:MAG TPA: beta-propeller fold lactonase family protein [Kofleriaceae bacterium]|nr:beta-propeller fold lactonase family protein [Kofleriaceae bacterium]